MRRESTYVTLDLKISNRIATGIIAVVMVCAPLVWTHYLRRLREERGRLDPADSNLIKQGCLVSIGIGLLWTLLDLVW